MYRETGPRSLQLQTLGSGTWEAEASMRGSWSSLSYIVSLVSKTNESINKRVNKYWALLSSPETELPEWTPAMLLF